MHDTIFALATARGRAGVAVVRVSGPSAWDAVSELVKDLPKPKQSALRVVRTLDGEPLDEALILTFESGASFTGERVVELHLHGSVAVVAAVLRELSNCKGTRLAEAGEFTRQALDNDRLDLAQVEGLVDFNIGHSIVARSVFVGMRQATREMIDLIDKYSWRY